MADLSKVSIGIKTFLRDSHLFDAIAGIRANLAECEIVIADDGHPTLSEEKTKLYTQLSNEGHLVSCHPFDSGFGYKSNWIAQNFRRDYLLVASDDFDFSPPEVVRGIKKLVDVLDNTAFDIASGRVNNWPYEFDLEDRGDTVIEHRVVVPNHPELWVVNCDLTVNYSLIKRRVFEKVGWIDEARIGQGEHGIMFLDCKRAGFSTVYVPGVNINTQRKADPPEYKPYRARANSPERLCFQKRGIKKYVLGNGQVDYEEGR
jgi:glycosyltransferase involved in cell wall biosynthesis